MLFWLSVAFSRSVCGFLPGIAMFTLTTYIVHEVEYAYYLLSLPTHKKTTVRRIIVCHIWESGSLWGIFAYLVVCRLSLFRCSAAQLDSCISTWVYGQLSSSLFFL